MDEYIILLGDVQVFAKLDATSGYSLAGVDKGDGEDTAFTSHRGLSQFIGIPFGFEESASCVPARIGYYIGSGQVATSFCIFGYYSYILQDNVIRDAGRPYQT